MTLATPTQAALWPVRIVAFAGFAVGVAILAPSILVSQFFAPESVATGVLYLVGGALWAGAAAATVGVALTSNRDSLRFRPALASLAAVAITLLRELADWPYGWLSAVVEACFNLTAPTRSPPLEDALRSAAHDMGTLTAGLVGASLAIAVVTRLGALPRLERVGMQTSQRPWLACALAALLIQPLTGRWGIDSYVFGFPLPFFDSSISGQGLRGPTGFWLIGVFADVVFLAPVLYGAHRLVTRILSRLRRARRDAPSNPALQPAGEAPAGERPTR